MDKTTAALAYAKLTGPHWTSAEDPFSRIDHIHSEACAQYGALAYDHGNILVLYLSDLLELVADARDRLPFTHSREFQIQFAMREVNILILAAILQMACAAKQYENGCVTKVIPVTTERERNDWRYSIQTHASAALDAVKDAKKSRRTAALDAVKDAKKSGRTAEISSVTKAALYYLDWQAYIILDDIRRAEIVHQAVAMYAAEDEDISFARVNMGKLITGDLDLHDLVGHILAICSKLVCHPSNVGSKYCEVLKIKARLLDDVLAAHLIGRQREQV